jgi:hypothetical protein
MVSFNDYVAYGSQLGDLIQPEARGLMARPEGTSAQRARRTLDRAEDIMRAQTQRETAESNRDVGIATILGLLGPAARGASAAVRSAQGARTFARSNDLMRKLQANERAASQMYKPVGPNLPAALRGANRVLVPPVALAQVDSPITDLGEEALLLDQRMPMGPAGIAAASVNEGGEVATSQNQDRRESSFLDTLLGNVDVAGLLQVFARPEFLQPGQSFAQSFSRAAAARTAAQQGQEAAEAKAQREQEELDIARQRAEAAMLSAQRSGTTPRALGITGPKVDEFKAAIDSEPAFVDAITKFSQKGTTWLSRRFGEGIDEDGIKSRVALDAIAIQQRTGATPSVAIQAAIAGLGGTPQKAETGGDPFANIGR